MCDISSIKPTLMVWELALNLNRPSFITKVEMRFRFEDMGSDEKPILWGMASVYMERENKCLEFDYCGDCDTYHDEESKRDVQETLLFQVEDFLRWEMEDGKHETFWDGIDWDKEKWKDIK